MVGTLLRGVGVHLCVTFNFGSAKVCSPAIFETFFSTAVLQLINSTASYFLVY